MQWYEMRLEEQVGLWKVLEAVYRVCVYSKCIEKLLGSFGQGIHHM